MAVTSGRPASARATGIASGTGAATMASVPPATALAAGMAACTGDATSNPTRDMREDDFDALEREIRAKVKKIVSEDSRLSEQAIEEETSMQMEGLRQWSRDLQQQDAVLRK